MVCREIYSINQVCRKILVRIFFWGGAGKDRKEGGKMGWFVRAPSVAQAASDLRGPPALTTLSHHRLQPMLGLRHSQSCFSMVTYLVFTLTCS